MPFVGGRSRTSSPSGRRHSMGADATHGTLADRRRGHAVISVHGYWGHDDLHAALLVGGRDRELAASLGGRLRAALPEYRVIDELDAIPRRLRGIDPRNPVNRAERGVQVELPHPVRAI